LYSDTAIAHRDDKDTAAHQAGEHADDATTCMFPHPLFSLLLTGMLDHIATGFGTRPTRLGAFLHVLVVRMFFASGATIVASLRTRFTDGDRHRAVAGGDLGRSPTDFRTVRTGPQGDQMLLFPRGEEPCTMIRTRFALAQAIGARLRAFVQGTGMLVVGVICPRGAANCQGREESRDYSDRSQYYAVSHSYLPFLEFECIASFDTS
jgi:hypothetical protein